MLLEKFFVFPDERGGGRVVDERRVAWSSSSGRWLSTRLLYGMIDPLLHSETGVGPILQCFELEPALAADFFEHLEMEVEPQRGRMHGSFSSSFHR